MPTFEEFLREKHAKDYHGTDDDMPDAFEKWLDNKYPETLIQYSEAWHSSEMARLPSVGEINTLIFNNEFYDNDARVLRRWRNAILNHFGNREKEALNELATAIHARIHGVGK